MDSLNAKAKAAGLPDCAVSLAGAHHSEANERAAMDGKYDMIYVTPERLVMDAFIAKLRRLHEGTGILAVVVDEAHLVSSQGRRVCPPSATRRGR